MFYAHCVLSKKSPLRRVWLAAHWETKLTKAQVFQTNIETSVTMILEPRVKISLRTSGHLLLGVARILGIKARYLLADCSEACVRMKMVFQPRMIDLPDERREAPRSAITLPESFHDLDASLQELGDVDIPEHFVMSFNYESMDRGTPFEEIFDEPMEIEELEQMRDMSSRFISQNEVSESHNIREEDLVLENHLDVEKMNSTINEDGFGGVAIDEDVALGDFGEMTDYEVELAPQPSPATSPGGLETLPPPSLACSYRSSSDLTTLIQNDQETFALAPVLTDNGGKGPKRKRKRKLVVDTTKTIPGEELKAQQKTADCLVTPLTIAPPTRRLMLWQARGGGGQLLLWPSRNLGGALLLDFQDSLRNIDRSQEPEEQERLRNMTVSGGLQEVSLQMSLKRKREEVSSSQRKMSKVENIGSCESELEVYEEWDTWRGEQQVHQEVEQEVQQEVQQECVFRQQNIDDMTNEKLIVEKESRTTKEVEDEKAVQLHQQLRETFVDSFSQVTAGRSRREVAVMFRAVLELQRRGVLEVEQEEGQGYGEVGWRQGLAFCSAQ